MTSITTIVLAFNREKIDQHAVNEKNHKTCSKIIVLTKKKKKTSFYCVTNTWLQLCEKLACDRKLNRIRPF